MNKIKIIRENSAMDIEKEIENFVNNKEIIQFKITWTMVSTWIIAIIEYQLDWRIGIRSRGVK